MKRIETRHTKETGVIIAHVGPGHWRHIDTSDNRKSVVGPIYRTKDEIMSAHEEYMRECWGVV